MSSDLCCGSRLLGWGLPGVCSQWSRQSSGVHPVLGEGKQHVWKVSSMCERWRLQGNPDIRSLPFGTVWASVLWGRLPPQSQAVSFQAFSLCHLSWQPGAGPPASFLSSICAVRSQAMREGNVGVCAEFKWCLQGSGKCNSIWAVCWQFCNSSPWIRDRMKSLGPNQKQLIRSPWGSYQFIAAETQRAEVPEAGWIKVMKLNTSAGQSRTTSGEGYGPLSPSGRMRNRLYAKTWIGREAAMELARAFQRLRCVCQEVGAYEKEDVGGFL